MSQLKLTADSGGGTVAIKAPASTTGNAALDLTVPGTASATLDTLKRAGNILQVKQTIRTDTVSAAIAGNSTEYTPDMITLDFQCSSTSNKILIMGDLSYFHSQTQRTGVVLFAGGAVVTGAVGGSDGNRVVVSKSDKYTQGHTQGSFTHNFLHSPNSTSNITYSYRFLNLDSTNDDDTIYLNRDHDYTNAAYNARSTSSITIMEIAA